MKAPSIPVQLPIALALPLLVVLVIIIFSGRSEAQPKPVPPTVVERVTSRQLVSGGQALDPPAAGVQPALDDRQIGRIAVDLDDRFPGTAAVAKRLTLRLAVYSMASPGATNVYVGRLIYSVTGDNRVACPHGDGPVRDQSLLPRGTPPVRAASPTPPQGAVVASPPRASFSDCAWVMTIDANSGEFISMLYDPDPFCVNAPC